MSRGACRGGCCTEPAGRECATTLREMLARCAFAVLVPAWYAFLRGGSAPRSLRDGTVARGLRGLLPGFGIAGRCVTTGRVVTLLHLLQGWGTRVTGVTSVTDVTGVTRCLADLRSGCPPPANRDGGNEDARPTPPGIIIHASAVTACRGRPGRSIGRRYKGRRAVRPGVCAPCAVRADSPPARS